MRKLWPLLLLVMASCGTTRNVVGEGRFQRRTLSPGWHVDLHGNAHERSAHERTKRLHVLHAAPIAPVIPAEERLLAYTSENTSARPASAWPMRRPLTRLSHTRSSAIPGGISTTPLHVREQERDEQVTPVKEMNKLAIPAFVLALLTVGAGFTLQSVGAVALAVVATVVLAAIALRQIRMREQRGKGFALVALIIGLIAALFTALVILWTVT